MRLKNYSLFLISFFIICSFRLHAQSLANYTTTRTTGITYSSIDATGNAIDSWRYAVGGGFSQDDNRSNPTDIGFDFWYNGTRYTQFSVSTNGYVDFSASTADGGPDGGDYSYDNTAFTGNGSGTWLALAPFYDDMTAQGGTDALGNSIKYLVTGTAPNRVLTIEWINMAVYLNTSPDLNFQVKLYETTGQIDFVYGTMTQGTNTFSYTCGINAATLANTPTTAQLKTQQTANSNTFNNTQQNNLVTLPASNSKISFVPPATTPSPSGSLTFTGVTQTGMTVNWTNWCTNEVGYAVYGSTDGINYGFVTQTAVNATSYTATGLLPSTVYYWKVYAVTEGYVSAALSGSQSTAAAGNVISVTTGNWNTASTWNCACVPNATDNVTIANTHTVTINADASCNTLTVGQGASGILRIGNNNTSRTITVNSNILVNSGATFDVSTTSNTTHNLSAGGNITNNGTLNFSPDANSFCDVDFVKNGNQTISGSATTNNFHNITLDMGSSINNMLDVNSTNFSAAAGFLTLNAGMFRLSTTGTVAITPFSAQATIPNKAGITSNSATGTINFGAGIDLYGSLIVNSGAVNVGNANNESVASNGGVFQITGGTTKIAGCYYSADINTLAKFTISGGTVTLPAVGSTSTTIAPFQIDGVGSSFTMSGGTIIIERKGGGGSNLGYTVTGVTNSAVTGGTLQIGDASTPAAQTMNINSSCRVGNLLVNSANATAMLTTNPLQVTQNVTITAGTLNLNNLDMTLEGNWVNNATFTPGTGTVIFDGTSGQSIGGSVVSAYRGLTISDAAGVTLALNTSVAGTLTFTAGVINTGTNKVTVTSTGSVTGAGTAKFVNGFLEKNVTTGNNIARTYEIGNGSSDYLPLAINFARVTTAGNLTASVYNGDHPSIATSCIDPAESVNRYWRLTNSGVVFTNYSATCTFLGLGSDADAGSTPANYYVALLNGTTWTTLTAGTVTATSTQGTGATTFGDLQVGERKGPTITTQPLPVTVCNGTTATFTVAGTAITGYQWQVNTGSGFVNLTNTGVYTGVTTNTLQISAATVAMSGYQYRCVLTGGTCGGTTTSTAVALTVNPSVAASVSIAASPSTTICAGTSVTFTATSVNGGTTPVYQWKVNGVNVGTNSSTYTTATLTNGNTVTCVVTSNAACVTGSPATSNTLTMTVNPNLPVSVSIAASPSATVCAGTSVTFTATPTNGGTTPVYQWKVNGSNVGTSSGTYTSASLNNGDVVTCQLTSNATCATGSPATSNTITMTVNPNLPASVSIAASPSSTICAGTSVTFTATPTNGGTTPTYQWKLNGSNVGTNSPTYTNASLANGNTITCVMTSNATCATGSPATSNTITMTVNPNLPASVSIAASPSATICAGTSVTFTATPTNGGTTPTYQWKLNGSNVGTNSPTYTNAALTNGNTVTCVLTSNATCATGSPATSNTITMTVNPNLPASVSIAASSTSICPGTSVTFTATPTNGGTTPAYQWKLNGSNVGTGAATYSSSSLNNGDVVTCVMTSNATPCLTGSPATSNSITITVNPSLPVSVSIAASPSATICAGTSVTFTATPTNGGTTPSYQWKLNGANVGTNSPTYTNAALTNGNTITCVMTSTASCGTGSPATSNTITMTVNPNLPVSVSIAASPSATICASSSVTFTATPTNGGTTPTYQWKVNGSNVGTNSATYTSATLNNSDVVTCQLTSNATCATGSPATSNTITMTVNPNLPVSVSIAASPSATICAGSSVTFTATPTNGGTTPAYQWKVNGGNVGTNSATYTSATLNNGDVVTCQLTSNATCATGSPAASNTITMTVNLNLPVSVSIVASPAGAVCAGTNVSFTATPVNGGTTPSYQWLVNGVYVGTNAATYSNATLGNGDLVTCVVTSNATCATGNPATSNTVTMAVNPSLPVSVSVAASPSASVCAGTSVTFTATPVNGGTTPSYQWQLNGSNTGTNAATYTSSTLNNGDAITCIVTSNAACATGSPAVSSTVSMTVSPNVPVSVSITASPSGAACSGSSVTFTATPVNGGTTPSYQWKVNGSNVGTGSATYSSSSLSNGDVITCVLTSNASCITGNPATSNAITQSISASGSWMGTVSSDWNDAGNWCGSVPTSTTDVKVTTGTPFAPALSVAADCRNIDLAAGATVDLSGYTLNVYGAFSGTGTIIGSAASSLNITGSGTAGTFYMNQGTAGVSNVLQNITLNRSGITASVGSTLNVTGTVGINAGTLDAGNNLTLVSNAAGTARVAELVPGADITGNVTMQRYIPGGTDGWMFLCAPVSGITLQQWDDDFITGGFPGSQYPTSVTNASINGYDETLPGTYDDGYTVPSNITDPIIPRRGYWAYIINTPVTVDVTGPLLKNQQVFPVTYTPDPTQPASENGWNLLANPYPSTIDWDAAGWTKTNVNDAIYMYSPTLDQYTSYVGGIGINGGSNLIASSQAFLVQTNAPGPVLKLQESAKSVAGGLFIRSSAPAVMDNLLKLDLAGSSYSDETVIHFNSAATPGFDLPFDAMKFFSFNPDVPGIASMLDDTTNMSVNTFPALTGDLAIPVKVKVGISGTYTIKVDSLTRLPANVCVSMHDLLTGVVTDLRTTPSYSFTISDTTRYPRFMINIEAPVQTAAVPALCNGNANGMAVAIGQGSGPWTYTWQNAAGTVIQTHTNISGADTLHHITAGAYTVTVNGNPGYCGTRTGTINVGESDSMEVETSVANAGCSGDADGSIVVTAVNGGHTPYSYSWSNGPAGPENAGITAGTYTLSVTDSTGCVQQQQVTVPQNSALTAGFSMSTDTVWLNANAPVVYNNLSAGGTSYTWDFGDGSALNTNFTPSYLYKLPGTYTVSLVATDGTCTDTLTQTIIVMPYYYSDPGTTTGIAEAGRADDQVKVGTQQDGQIDLLFDLDKATDVVIEAYNSIGQQVFIKLEVTVHKGKVVLPFGDQAKGIYYIRISSREGMSIVKKVVRS